jgi:hypothetical protein
MDKANADLTKRVREVRILAGDGSELEFVVPANCSEQQLRERLERVLTQKRAPSAARASR